ncbi:A/G-specific adenine glycosylase [Parapusillimonas sp. JC17]|uniref:A/G-specific adenine glycosylase n=1 Tax=Parapusillimonas sp. JC17 TaxID=3445768 RepID=UPI003F9F928C
MPNASNTPVSDFPGTVTEWQKREGRHHLPWQGTRDPYCIWLSEIMLQQTQVTTVIGYYTRFLERFPTIQALAQAEQEEVMPYWAGLGYYARARNLHRCAREICQNWSGRFPGTSAEIATLPGIGRSTAAAIAAFAYGERSPIMDGNVKRVFTRHFGIFGVTSARVTEQALWDKADAVLTDAPPSLDMAAYTQGLMDLGSTVCMRGKPACGRCPLQHSCYAYAEGRQSELPSPKPRKEKPERDCAMLVLTRGGAVLLERRPSTGIWGGLWSLPEFPDAEALASGCADMGLDASLAQRMGGLAHVFTHFKLNIEPWYLEWDAPETEEPTCEDHIWVSKQDLANAALPAPVRKILDGLAGSEPMLF